VKATNKRGYRPSFRPDLRWRQEICDQVFILAYLEAWVRRPALIKGYSGWHIKNVSHFELANFFEAG
jgi:hypothetical protein